MKKRKRTLGLTVAIVILVAIGIFIVDQVNENRVIQEKDAREEPMVLEIATLSGGCFWCMEHPFEELAGVYEVVSGYTGGVIENPTYLQVASGKTQHIESVQIHYDPRAIDF